MTITTSLVSTAEPSTIHRLLVDVEAWSIWSPHVASVDPPTGEVAAGWEGSTRAFFSPGATEMIVDEVIADGGYTWHCAVGPWTLRYRNAVTAGVNGGSTITFAADLHGPAATVIERIVGPVSALGQRRRMHRLARSAELVERLGGPSPPR
ncbi:MAG: SRPBCC family protein [Actinomycetota bacterium]